MSEYRLGPVRTLREVGERVSRGALADAVGDVAVTAVAVERARTRVEAIRATIAAGRGARGELVDASTIASADRYLARLRRELDAAVADELRARATHGTSVGVVDLAHARHAHARAEREAIERHFTTWREARRKLADRREE